MGGDDEVLYELEAWTPDERLTLAYLLRGHDIEHTWEDSTLVVASGHEQEVDELVAYVEAGTRPPIDVATDDIAAAGTAPPVIAGPGRRAIGFVADGIVLLVPSALFLQIVDSDRDSASWWAAAVALQAAYYVGGVRFFGRTVGKAAAGTRVVSERTGERPSWGAAFARWIVPSAVTMASFFVPGSDTLDVPWSALVYGSLLFDERRRGLHDRVAGTIVVNAEMALLERRS